MDIKKPNTSFLYHFTDTFGMFQHSIGNTPDPKHGYAVDDNARALMEVYLYRKVEDESFGKDLEKIYLNYIKYSQVASGKFSCYETTDKKRLEIGTRDWFGRALMASSMSYYFTKNETAAGIIQKSLPLFPKIDFHLRTMSFLVFSIYYQGLMAGPAARHPAPTASVTSFPAGARAGSPLASPAIDLNTTLTTWLEFYKGSFNKNKKPSWYWPEEKITYDNGKVIQAYLLLGELLNSKDLIKIGLDMLEFYISKVFSKDYLQIPGNKGWVTKDSFPFFDEQPLEVYSLIAALISAFLITKKKDYLKVAEKAYMWFWGKNRLGIIMVDEKSGGVYDGLLEKGHNNNEGAESYLSLLLSYCLLKYHFHA